MSRKNRPLANHASRSLTVTAQRYRFSGPLPAPEVLRKYDEIVPGAAERIIRMAEEQSAHRRRLEQAVVVGDIASARRGSILAFILAIGVIAGGFALIATGKDAYGIAAIIAALASLAGVFVYGRRRKSKDLEANREAIAGLESRGSDRE